jgi:uncharacterized protein (DUF58 family)
VGSQRDRGWTLRGLWPWGLAQLAPLFTHDFCPWANRYVYWLKHPLAVLALVAAVSGLIGLSVAPQGYVVCASVVAVKALGIVWPWVAMRGLEARLRFDRRRAREGETVSATLTVVNRMPWPVWGVMLEKGLLPSVPAPQEPGGTSPLEIALALDRIPAFCQCDFCWDYKPPLRGEYPQQNPRLSTAFPFGLWKAGRPVAVHARLLVWPRIVPLPELPFPQGHHWTAEPLPAPCSGQEEELLGTRPYRRGDSLRHIHWAQTARHEELIVCERQVHRAMSVRLLFDVGREDHFGSGPDSSFEWTLRIAASFCHLLLARHTRLTVEWGQESRVVPPGQAGERQINDALARLAPPRNEGGCLAGPRGGGTSSRRPPSCLEIVITTRAAFSRWARASGGACRRIVLVLGCGEEQASPPTLLRSEAIVLPVDLSRDVAEQLRLYGSKLCHDAWAAV